MCVFVCACVCACACVCVSKRKRTIAHTHTLSHTYTHKYRRVCVLLCREHSVLNVIVLRGSLTLINSTFITELMDKKWECYAKNMFMRRSFDVTVAVAVAVVTVAVGVVLSECVLCVHQTVSSVVS